VSVLDEFRAAEDRVTQRLKELEPMVAEYRELEAVAQRLGIQAATDGNADSGARRRRRTRRAPAKSGSGPRESTSTTPRRARRAGAAQREQQVLELVGARPGITVREAGESLGVDPTSLYRVVRRLEERGQVRKDGRSLQTTGAPAAGHR
jgi:transcriptional regulator with GAF, ATPase, and Fis domain